MKFPIINKYYSINLFIYITILCAISGCITNCLIIFERFGYLWLLSVGIFAITELSIPIIIAVSLLEILCYKARLLKYQTLVININPNLKIFIYTIAIVSFIYYLWFKIYYEPILDKMLQFD